MTTPDSDRWQLVVADENDTGLAVRLDDDAHRVDLGLAFLGGRKVVDVSVDPASWVGRSREASRELRQPLTRWADALAVALRRAGVERGWWPGLPEQLAPEVTAAAAAWPLLRPAIEAGADERVVPRWAAPLCSARDVASGTRAVLGQRANRRVIREMANALAGPIRWWSIACATALDELDGDRIGDMLAESQATHRCTQDEWLLLSRTLRSEPPAVTRQLLASADGDDRPARLLAALDGWQRISGRRRFIANRLDRLEAEVLAELEVPPPPPIRPEPQLALDRAIARRPPPAPRTTPDRIDYPDTWQRLHRARRGSVELVLPANRHVIGQWATALDNCLNNYGQRVERQDTVIVGVRHNGRLVGAVEIDPNTRRIRQAEGFRNRPLPQNLHYEVMQLLAAHNVGLARGH